MQVHPDIHSHTLDKHDAHKICTHKAYISHTQTALTKQAHTSTKHIQAPITSTPPLTNWAPNEGQLVQGGQLIMDLQREISSRPSLSQMQSRLETRMSISRSQAKKIIEELGLN